MDKNKGSENTTGKKVGEESKIPKSTKLPCVKEKSSKIQVEKKVSKSLKTTEMVSTYSSKVKQTHTINLQKNVKPMSIAKISKDVINQLQLENLKTDDHTKENVACVPVMDKEIQAKRIPLKEKTSQTSKGTLSKKPSASDLKPTTAFGGMKFTAKRNQKSDIFQKMEKESKKNCQDAKPKESRITEITPDPNHAIVNGKKKLVNDENSEKPLTSGVKAKKATLVSTKEIVLKKAPAFKRIGFAPKWKSTPLKPDMFDNVQKKTQHKELYPTDSSKWLEETEDMQTLVVPVGKTETVTTQAKEAEYLTNASVTFKETSDKICIAFAGMRLTPKRKSTHKKVDIFESDQKNLQSDGSETTSKEETRCLHAEKLEQHSTKKIGSLEIVSIISNEAKPLTAFGGIHFAPKWKSTPVRPDIFNNMQMELKPDNLESPPIVSLTKESKKIPNFTKNTIKVESQQINGEKETLSTPKPESSTNATKNVKEIVPKPVETFAGLRFKARQKNLRDIFEAQRNQIDTKVQNGGVTTSIPKPKRN